MKGLKKELFKNLQEQFVNLDKQVELLEKIEEALNQQLILSGVVKSFYCNQDDGEYNNNPCIEQCKFCKEVEELQ